MEGSDSQVSYVHFNVSPTFIFNLQSLKSILEGANTLIVCSVVVSTPSYITANRETEIEERRLL